jgi:cytosol alanyl aminopeptidase
MRNKPAARPPALPTKSTQQDCYDGPMFPRLFALSFAATLICLAADTPPKLRLGDEVTPTKYAVDLTLVPGSADFSGAIDIDVTLSRSTSLIWLNRRNITITEARVTAGGKTQTATVEPGGEQFAGLRVPAAVAAGAARLHLQYKGKISDKSSEGIFSGHDGNETYLFTQFEEIDARRAYPCFDQPNFKTPWQVTLHVKKDQLAFANTPQVSETGEPNNMKKVVFAPTKPLPSYLVAFAVGPFDVTPAGTAGKNHVAIRIITPKGKGYQAKYAVEVTGPILDQLEKYFGIPYPYEKLDEAAIPLTFGFAAMENAGLVTYAQNIILGDPAIDTERRRRGYAEDAAHELAHQWFGDLVTTAWWDDIWLNEAFATWTSSKIIAGWKPEWNGRLSDVVSKFGAMAEDGLATARRIRQPIETEDDISDAFDGITYQKGAAVIRMFESWEGEKQFQTGVTSYLKRYAFKNARVGDFLDAIAGTSQPRLPHAFTTFLEQPGFPEVSVDLKCTGTPAIGLSQKRYLPIGSTGAAEQWQVPVCVRYQTAKGPQSECFLLDKPSAEFKLTKAETCPAYLTANDGSTGYYIANYQGALLAKLVNTGSQFLSASEQLTLLSEVSDLAAAGDLKESRALDAALIFSKSPERQIVSKAREVVADVRNLVPDKLLPNYARLVNKAFALRAAQLGWSAKPGDSQEVRLLRANLVSFVADQGGDTALQAEARRLADGWLKNRKGIDSDMVASVLNTAARFGNRQLFDRLQEELGKTKDLQQRQTILGALGAFRDRALVKASLQLVLDPAMDARETVGLLFGPLGNPATKDMPFEFVQANYDALVQRLPSGGGSDAGANLPFVGGSACDETSRRKFVDFFQDRVKQFTGGPHNYAEALEGIRLCEARKSALGADVAEFLARQ